MKILQISSGEAKVALLFLLISFTSASSAAEEYCKLSTNKCIDSGEKIERGLTANGVYFVLRPDGSGCFGLVQGALDCGKHILSKLKSGDRPWLVSCFSENSNSVCVATNTSSAKLRFSEREGWMIGIGHNNYLNSPIRIVPKRGKQEELDSDDGWLPRSNFGRIFQFLSNPAAGYVEWVEEELIQYGPKWRSGQPDEKTMQSVFEYMAWAVRNKIQKPADYTLPEMPTERTSAQPEVTDCYSLRIGASLTEATRKLGSPTTIEDDFVNSAGVRGVTVNWQSETAICKARFQPTLSRYSVTDTRNLDLNKIRPSGRGR